MYVHVGLKKKIIDREICLELNSIVSEDCPVLCVSDLRRRSSTCEFNSIEKFYRLFDLLMFYIVALLSVLLQSSFLVCGMYDT